MIKVNNFVKKYNNTIILEIAELNISGAISWFRGVNGSGKSTFFKALSGIIPFEGRITIQDTDILNEPLQGRSRINYAFAEPVFPSFLSGKDVLEYCARTNGASLENLYSLVDIFEIIDWFKKPCGTYSSGMNKKISLIAAFTGDPEILALDEPLTTIDAHSQIILAKLIKKRKEIGKTTLIASHQELGHLIEMDEEFIVDNHTIKSA